MSLPRYNITIDDLPDEDVLNLVKKKLKKLYFNRMATTESKDIIDPSGGDAEKNIIKITNLLNDGVLLINNIDTVVVQKGTAIAMSEPYRFQAENLYYNFMESVNKLISILLKINNLIEDTLPNINFVSPNVMDDFRSAYESSKDLYSNVIFREVYNPNTNRVLISNKIGNKKINFDVLGKRLKDLFSETQKFNKMYQEAITSYNLTQKKRPKELTGNGFDLVYRVDKNGYELEEYI